MKNKYSYYLIGSSRRGIPLARKLGLLGGKGKIVATGAAGK